MTLLIEPGASTCEPERLELLGAVAYGAGDLEATLTAWEDLHALHGRASDDVLAARAAVTVALYLLMDTGLMAPVRARLARRPPPVGDCGDAGARDGRDAASALGRVAGARTRIFAGDLDGGMEVLDEVAVMLMSGEVEPLASGMVYCELICAMQGLGEYDRADEWTRSMDAWRGRGEFLGGINGRSRVHRAEMLRLRGHSAEAEDEALHACEELRSWMRREFGWR